jgi:lipoprotein-anchoring transpeptidase ErfK/SrfK
MRAWLAAAAVLALATSTGAQQPARQEARAPSPAKPPIDRTILHVQVILDKLGFGPGILDGREGISLTAALKGYQVANDLPITGKIDQATLRSLHRYRAIRPTKTIALTPEMLAGPFVNPIPEDYNQAAMLPAMAYRSPLEKLAEMFHTTPGVLVELNSRETLLKPGTQVVFPNALPGSRAYDPELPADWRQRLSSLNVDANQRQGERIVVDESEGVLQVFDKADRLIAQFSATMGSEKFPLPLGTWEVKGPAYNPPWNFDPDLIANTKPGAKEAVVPPGPNNPVGVVWLDLSKEHYGIHGTSEPQNIGRSESNGCIRLTNWDAARLALMVKAGTKAVFQA